MCIYIYMQNLYDYLYLYVWSYRYRYTFVANIISICLLKGSAPCRRPLGISPIEQNSRALKDGPSLRATAPTA